MRYGRFLKENGTIGCCAPSLGITISPYVERQANAIKKFNELGHKVVCSPSVYKMRQFASASAKRRADEFMQMYADENVDYIISAGGGEFMLEILPYINFKKLSKLPPKWFQGFSDNTTLDFTLTTICDVASVYGVHLQEFGASDWHRTLKDNYEFMIGNNKEVESLDFYEVKSLKRQPGNELCSYNLEKPVKWKVLTKEKDVHFEGRIIGGCLDILLGIVGTKFDNVKNFIEKYKEDGIIWVLESCDLTVPAQLRGLLQLKQAGWFEHVKGFIIGRPRTKEYSCGYDYKTANLKHLRSFGVPVIIDADFGHVAPTVHFVSGSYAHVDMKDGKAKIKYELI